MRIKHKVPVVAMRSDPVTPEYQAEVDRATSKAMAKYERAQRNLLAAERRLERATSARNEACTKKRARTAAREVVAAERQLEVRRQELQRLAAMMQAAPASAEHRGDRSYRPVPNPGRLV